MGLGGRIARRFGMAIGLGLLALALAGCVQPNRSPRALATSGLSSTGLSSTGLGIASLVAATPSPVNRPYSGLSFGWNPSPSSTATKIGPPPVEVPAAKPAAAAVSDEDRRCFAANLFYEAGGEGERGLIAVGHVVLNRLAERPAGTTICAVIYERMQFSWTRTLRRHDIVLGSGPRWDQAIALTDQILAGRTKDPTGGATHFYSLISYKKHRPAWARSRVETVRIVNHAFLR